MLSRSIRSLSAAALALTGVAVLAPSAQAAEPATGWRVHRHFSVTGLRGVAASATDSAVVFGDASDTTPASYEWDGRHWEEAGITANQVSYLSTVSTTGPQNTWFFGHKELERISNIGEVSRSVHWDGTTWATADLPNVGVTPPNILSSVTLSPTNTWAFGSLGGPLGGAGAPYMAHFTEKKWIRWTRIPTLNRKRPGRITNAVALSWKDIWALVVFDDYAPQPFYYVLHYDGQSWTSFGDQGYYQWFFRATGGLVVRSSRRGDKRDIWLASSSLLSHRPGALHYDGLRWFFIPVSTSGGHELREITDDGQGGVWALAGRFPSELWHYANGGWSKVPLANNADIDGLSHIPGTSTTLGIGTDSWGPAVFVTGRF